MSQGEALLEGRDPRAVIADKGYDSGRLVRRIEEEGAEAVIPPKKNRKELRDYDKHLYKERDKVERFIRLLKRYRRGRRGTTRRTRTTWGLLIWRGR